MKRFRTKAAPVVLAALALVLRCATLASAATILSPQSPASIPTAGDSHAGPAMLQLATGGDGGDELSGGDDGTDATDDDDDGDDSDDGSF